MRPPIINRDAPRVQVSVDWGTGRPAGDIVLLMRRVGDPENFAAYAPIEEYGGNITFQFDELLFVRPQGRYRGTLVVGALEYTQIDVEYSDKIKVVSVENPNHV